MKKINKKSFIIYGIILLAVIISIVVFFVLKDKKVETPNNPPTNQNVMEEEMKSLIEANYKLSYAFMGNVKTGESYIEVENQKYYVVLDENIDFTSLNEIDEYIKNHYSSSFNINVESIDKYHKYLEANNRLYILKNNSCQNFPELITDFNSRYMQQSEDEEDLNKDIIFIFDNNYQYNFYAYKEDSKWVLNSLDFKCLDEQQPVDNDK